MGIVRDKQEKPIGLFDCNVHSPPLILPVAMGPGTMYDALVGSMISSLGFIGKKRRARQSLDLVALVPPIRRYSSRGFFFFFFYSSEA